MNTAQNLHALRQAMIMWEIDAYIIPSSDPHQSEYVADHWKVREWLSGFDGSAGTLVVTQDWAGLWTDSRYFLQAEQQLAGSGIALMKKEVGKGLEYDEYLAEKLTAGSIVGLDGRLFSVFQLQLMEETLSLAEIEIAINSFLIESIWLKRPLLSDAPIVVHDLKYAGQSRVEKLSEIRAKMREMDADVYLVAALDEIAWLFNLRGSDTAFNPVFYAYASITKFETYLFVDAKKLSNVLQNQLAMDQIQIKAYGDFQNFIAKVAEEKVVLYDDKTLSAIHYIAIKSDFQIELNLIKRLKATKNEVQLAHLRKTMEKDGFALLKTFRWLEQELSKRTVSEYELGVQIAHFRSQQSHYREESFHPIVGYEANGAIVHYRATEKVAAAIQNKGILLVDSGGQYLDGTTDITRTVALGTPSDAQKHHFTLVLKGHIALARICFPAGTSGHQLDVLARQALWKQHLDYGHGTGHGVGFFLNVHESPPGISPSASSSGERSEFLSGMIVSNEPGYYETGEYGIRIENLILCVKDQESEQYGTFLKFETLSLFPIDQQLIDFDLLDQEEINWLNNYHQEVYVRLLPYLNTREQEWLKNKCRIYQT
ncbi:MAG: aminopeptidase P family protein [Bacteroidota bacterium]